MRSAEWRCSRPAHSRPRRPRRRRRPPSRRAPQRRQPPNQRHRRRSDDGLRRRADTCACRGRADNRARERRGGDQRCHARGDAAHAHPHRGHQARPARLGRRPDRRRPSSTTRPIRSRPCPDTPGRGGEVTVTTWTTSAAPDAARFQRAVAGRQQRARRQPQDQHPGRRPTTPPSNCRRSSPATICRTSCTSPPTRSSRSSPQFLKAKMADLTPYLSGDAVKDYPNLANFPTLAWQQVVFNNAIYGVPVPYPLFLWVHWVHQNLLDADGLERTRRTPTSTSSSASTSPSPTRTCAGMGAENNVGMGMTNGWLTGHLRCAQHLGARRRDRQADRDVETDAVPGRRRLRARPVGRRRLPPERAAVQPGQRAQRLRGAPLRVPLRRLPGAPRSPFWDNAADLDPPGKPRIMSPFPAVDGGKPTYWAQQRHPRLQRDQAGLARAHQGDAARAQLARRAARQRRSTC